MKHKYKIDKQTYSILEVLWLDHNGNATWKNYDRSFDAQLSVCRTLGYLVDETADVIVLAQSKGQPPSVDWNGLFTIAKVLIMKRRILFKGEK